MIKAEFKKLFIKNKLIYFALGVIVLSLIFQLSSNTYTQFSLDNQQSFYEEYMARLKGKTNEDKTAIISKIYNDYNNIGNELADLDNDYKNGNISTETYEEQREKLSEFSSCGNAVDYLVSCADYVNENPNRHYYIDYLGWTQVFQNYGFDFLLMIFVLAMSVGAVMIEYNSDMTAVNAVSEKGRKFYSTSKIILVLSFTALLTLILSVIYLVVFSFKYDLSGWNYPLESLLRFFKKSEYYRGVYTFGTYKNIRLLLLCCFHYVFCCASQKICSRDDLFTCARTAADVHFKFKYRWTDIIFNSITRWSDDINRLHKRNPKIRIYRGLFFQRG